MKLFASLDSRFNPKDRRMLLVTFGLVAVLFLVFAFFIPQQDPNDNPVPSSYFSGQHGAKAAFTLLEQSGYAVERWEQPLDDLAAQAAPGTVLILAEPITFEAQDRTAIAAILRKGGRILATGFQGGMLLPGNDVTFSTDLAFADCEAQPDGLSLLAGRGSIWIRPRAAWKETRPEIHTAYTCASQPVVVEYPVEKGAAVWWASSTPLENGSILRGQNLELLLNSLGPANVAGHPRHIYWDEAIHGVAHSQWDYVSGPTWPLLSLGALGLTLLTIFSFSRRSGPVRALPQAPRTTPIEFLDALGALYRSTGAASTAMQIAWERFRTQASLLTGQPSVRRTGSGHPDARQLFAAIHSRFGAIAAGMEKDVIEAEEACSQDNLKPRNALRLIQFLRRHEETLRTAGRPRF
jgi:hypothetical protein